VGADQTHAFAAAGQTAMTPDFYYVVRLLRALPEPYRVLVLHAAQNWSDDRLNAAEMEGDLLGQPEPTEPPAAPVLKLVPRS
jgi:hypothetical protein